MIPSWPKRAASAIVRLFQPLQDVDVYVEDTGDEQIYSELFRRISPSSVRVERVFAAGNRTSVLTKARLHDFSLRKALFLIDGDLDWVKGESPPTVRGVFRLDAYCIENLLLAEFAGVQLLVEQEAISEEEASTKLAFSAWQMEIQEPLLNLFVAFAVLNHVDPTQQTVSLGVGNLLQTPVKGSQPILDATKTDTLRTEILRKAELIAGKEQVEILLDRFERRARELVLPLDIVSGKDFLLPLFEYRLWSCTKNKCRRKSLRFRLARHCDRPRFKALTLALENIWST